QAGELTLHGVPLLAPRLGRPVPAVQFREPGVQLVEPGAGEDGRPGRVDGGVAAVDQADVVGDGAGRLDVVAGDHLDLDAGVAAVVDRRLDVVAQRVADGDETDEDEVRLQAVAPRVQAVLRLRRVRRQLGVAERQGAHRLL